MLFCLPLFLAELIPATKDVLVFFYDEKNIVDNKFMDRWIEFQSQNKIIETKEVNCR